jgi:hypothetical protein
MFTPRLYFRDIMCIRLQVRDSLTAAMLTQRKIVAMRKVTHHVSNAIK